PRPVRAASGRRHARRWMADVHRRLAVAQRNERAPLQRFLAALPRGDRCAHDMEGDRAAESSDPDADGTGIMNQGATSYIRISGQLIAGIVLAALGVLFTLDNLHIVHAREVLRYWPAVLLLIGISQILQSRSIAGTVG